MLPISYLIGVIMGIVVFSIFVGGIIGMIYFLWYQKRIIKNYNKMKGGTNNAEDKNEEGGGGNNRERTRGESKRRWFRRRKDPTTKIDARFKHGVQVSNPNPNPKPKPKPKPKPREDRTNSKQSWPSFS
jgi:hypothetical protein